MSADSIAGDIFLSSEEAICCYLLWNSMKTGSTKLEILDKQLNLCPMKW